MTAKEAKTPIRIRKADAARVLGISGRTLAKRIAEGLFTVFRPHGFGPRKPAWLLVEEVELCAREGEDALKEFRERKKRKTA